MELYCWNVVVEVDVDGVQIEVVECIAVYVTFVLVICFAILVVFDVNVMMCCRGDGTEKNRNDSR